ncbi:MAG: leucine-rich repeat protein [Gordonibacter pamelaeae]|uniref:leucine-rich repeat domain-containing protein n=2 Tax=Gordonibacter pamelaeae TaxID=471189 RepID=UPI00242F85AD|nr:leucine-rich repeat domain-containing protein [Gordonibacter pamelaeae]MBS4894668.1 leucine-rich repeat protein [Gordonibacter pamelaeae]HJH73966.1 leucine-rich repeat domain-containing protein [Eggerthellaceae bacterium]
MNSLRAYIGGRLGPVIAAGLAAALCVGAVVAIGAGLGSGAFDPSGFLGAGMGAQPDPDLSTAYDVEQSETGGEANMDVEEDRADEGPADFGQLNDIAYTEGSDGLSAFSVVDGPADATLSGGSGAGEDDSRGEGNSVVGPVVDGSGPGGADGDEPGGEGGGEPGGEGDGPDGPGPDIPAVDPDPGPSKLPEGLVEGVTGDQLPAFPEEGVPAPSPGQEAPAPVFEVIAGMDITDAYGVERLYSGELLTDWKLLCSTCCYLTVDGVQYRLTEFGENFQVGSYPRVLGEEETLEVEFRVRLNAESPWIVQTVEFTVYPYKLYVQGWEAGSYLATYYPEEDEAVDLNGHRDALFPEEVILGSLFDAVPLEEYFEGWADAADGSPVISQYEPAAKGLSIVRPLPFRPVPAGYEVQYSWGSQDLVGAPEDATVLDIPQGIDAVSIYDFDEPLEFDEVIVPESVQKLDLYSSYGTSVRTAYRVDERNRAYFSRDGMLFDAWEGALIGIPTEKAVVDVPAGTPSVALPQQNNIAELRLNSEQPPELDLGALDGAVIVVPDEHYVNYLKAWGSDFQGNSLITASGDAPDVYVRDGALLREGEDGSVVLEQVLEEAAGTFVVPAGVNVVESGAVSDCPHLEALVMPSTVRVLEAGSLAGAPALERVLFQGAKPPAAAAGAFDAEGVTACVVPTAFEAYADAWAASLGGDVASALLEELDFELRDVDGFAVLAEPSSNLLVKAPAAVERFTGDEPAAEGLTAVNARAFADCARLQVVVLPETVASIGREAFAGCAALEAFYQRGAGQVAVGASAFDGCEALRFAAFEAASASFDEPDSLPLVFPGFARQGAQGYPEFEFDLDSLSFDLAEQGRGMVLYAERAPGAAVEGWSLVKATSTASGIVTLREGTASIGTGAFSGCAGVTSADFEAARGLRSIGDAAFFGAGLAGAVIVPGSVDYLGYGAFTACTALKSVHIEGSQLVDLGASAFSDCTALESVIFGPACALETIGGEAFSGTAVERIELPDSVIVLDFSAFSGCSRLAVLELPAGIEEIRSDAFNGCASLEAVTFSGEEPPQLVMYSWNTPFTFGSGLPDGFRIVLEGEAQQDDYIEVWKYPLVGRDPGSDVLEPEEDLAGTNAVRALLGLPPLAAPPEPS